MLHRYLGGLSRFITKGLFNNNKIPSLGQAPDKPKPQIVQPLYSRPKINKSYLKIKFLREFIDVLSIKLDKKPKDLYTINISILYVNYVQYKCFSRKPYTIDSKAIGKSESQYIGNINEEVSKK